MTLRSLHVQNFRNHDDLFTEFSPNRTLIYGKNGTGKTSVIEAVYLLYRGVSFKGTDRDIINHTAEWYRADIDVDKVQRSVVYDARDNVRQKYFVIDGKKSARLPRTARLPVVLFTPDDLQLISGSPSRRRRYMDMVISQYDDTYSRSLRRYDRALIQRNKLLKSPTLESDDLFSWNIILSDNGAYITKKRREFIDSVSQRITKAYQTISHTDDVIKIRYASSVQTDQAMLRSLEESFRRDYQMGTTTIGPHRDDFLVGMRGKNADDTASRGEIRTILLAIKQIEAQLLFQYTEIPPIILLDDVYGELDGERKKHLAKLFDTHQVVITSTRKMAISNAMCTSLS